jgi:serine/threonine protein kinase
LKPENVLIGENGYPKLGDFGLSVDTAQPRSAAPKNFFVGTIDYCAPELFKKADFGPEHDVWAFGCLLYELVIGLPPFHAQDPRKTVQKVLTAAPDFKMFGSELRDLHDLLQRMMVKDPNKRLNSLQQVRDHAWFAKHIDFNKV